MAALRTVFICLLYVAVLVPLSAQTGCPQEVQQALTDCTSKAAKNADWEGVSKCAYDYTEKCQHVFKSTMHPYLTDEYDITINPTWSFLRKLGTEGWPIKLSATLKSQTPECINIVNCKDDEQCLLKLPAEERLACVSAAVDIKGCFVPWIGGFNVGKTFLLNEITGRSFNSSFGVSGETKGVNFILPKKKTPMKLIHVDNPGALRSVDPDDLKDRYMTDRFIEDLMPDIADRMVLVVDILTSDEQVLISRLMDRIAAFSTAKRPKQLYVLHNFKNLFTHKNVDSHIVTDIERAFGAEADDPDDPTYWSHMVNGFMVYHFVFAAQHSQAGSKWNTRSLNMVKMWLGAPCAPLKLNVLDNFLSKLTPLLRDYFPANVSEDRLGTETGGGIGWDIFARTKNWVGSFFQIGQKKIQPKIQELLPNLGTDPFKLQFEIAEGEEVGQFDGKIVLETPRELAYCNYSTTNIGDAPQCHPDPDCALLKSKETWKLQCVIPNEYTTTYSELREKFTVALDMEDDGSPPELKIFGTMLPPWKQFINKGENLELEYSDRKMFGWFSKSFQLPFSAIRYFDKKITTFKNGIFTVIVPISKEGVETAKKQEL